MLGQQFSGMNAVMFYCVKIFQVRSICLRICFVKIVKVSFNCVGKVKVMLYYVKIVQEFSTMSS